MKHLIGDKKRPHQFINWVKLGLSLCLSTSVIASQTAPVFAELEAIPEELQILRTEPWAPLNLGVEFHLGSGVSQISLVAMTHPDWQWGMGLGIPSNLPSYYSTFFLQSRYYLPAALIPELLNLPFHRLYLECAVTPFSMIDNRLFYLSSHIGFESRLLGSSTHLSAGFLLGSTYFVSGKQEDNQLFITPHIQVGMGLHLLQPLSPEYTQTVEEYSLPQKRIQLSAGTHFYHNGLSSIVRSANSPSPFQDWTLWYRESQWAVGLFLKSKPQLLTGAGLIGRWYLNPSTHSLNPFVEILGYTGTWADPYIAPNYSAEIFLSSKVGVEWKMLPGVSLDIGLGLGLMVSPFSNTTYFYRWDDMYSLNLPFSANINFSLPVTEPSSALPAPDIKAPDPRTDQNQPSQFEPGL
ncbi:MAG: hypothetical protein IV090_05310 [Candidatus Sericytochromatia bacterium]|nr:hypothetical protein [Candidatus Sericytochromatia bacterium]